ncbi:MULTISPECIES: tRNA uridine(34) 5-carboxymethylaminomethyl modification radical SAM/GNAT enzyme Elp3 [Candidatus Nitrosocaldus]|jgi:elongator complex protein 3|uniref:Elongator complex protein 3 n=1 Tax=Candidatus Nitrosocaldus cavascurensis TaxID=2058097 RepID=A0A2K5ASI9_9ARCH|nr:MULTISPECIES: tRNA uridine(34) 5-carboxymethylaminomethyl modification radical SAM/GNAT enzyme Elp3 [Candidatus Nitrosocaldus]SPC34605.1 ELP3 family histone acetyltransferase, elongator complex protein 3 [Candidatus Nitrosocaldus cavascurensis]
MQIQDSNEGSYEIACMEIAKTLIDDPCIDRLKVKKIIKAIANKYSLPTLPKNSDILAYVESYYHKNGKTSGSDLASEPLLDDKFARLKMLLMVKPSRTASGVAVISVMPKPYPCPHGRCIYCPGGVEVNIPNSYTPSSPATIVAMRHGYDPYMQIRSKLDALARNGHYTSKVELVIVGGTFLFMPIEYQRWFIKSCYDALNGFRSSTLEEAIAYNEHAEVRNVGFTVETKPDYCKEEHVDLMLSYGITRVEIGVQALNDRVYRLVNRGHTLQDVVDAFRIARDAGYKIVAHMMPGLPGSSIEQDIEEFRMLFNDPRFKPDMIKVYPTLVLKDTPLYKLYERGEYKPYSEEQFIELIARIKSMVPRWVRIMRIQREVDSSEIVAGVRHGNARQLALKRLREQGLKCRCIRCREAGLNYASNIGTTNTTTTSIDPSRAVLLREDYDAGNGREVFLSYEDPEQDLLFGFLRLRKVSSYAHRDEVKGNSNNTCIVRELHVYGQVLPLHKHYPWSYQHRGFGRMLMEEAERIARDEFHASKLLVISAVGTREYYKKLGYVQEGPYMGREL